MLKNPFFSPGFPNFSFRSDSDNVDIQLLIDSEIRLFVISVGVDPRFQAGLFVFIPVLESDIFCRISFAFSVPCSASNESPFLRLLFISFASGERSVFRRACLAPCLAANSHRSTVSSRRDRSRSIDLDRPIRCQQDNEGR